MSFITQDMTAAQILGFGAWFFFCWQFPITDGEGDFYYSQSRDELLESCSWSVRLSPLHTPLLLRRIPQDEAETGLSSNPNLLQKSQAWLDRKNKVSFNFSFVLVQDIWDDIPHNAMHNTLPATRIQYNAAIWEKTRDAIYLGSKLLFVVKKDLD